MPLLQRLSMLLLCLALSACSGERAESQSKAAPAPLLSAAEQGDLPGISRLLAGSTQVDIRDACLWTPLMKAALNGHLEAARRLIEAGADVNLTDKGGYSALMLAASNDHAELVGLLLAAGADPDQVEQTGGFTALIWAAQLGHTETVRRLLASPANRLMRDFDGKNAADRARENAHGEILALLEAAPAQHPLSQGHPGAH